MTHSKRLRYTPNGGRETGFLDLGVCRNAFAAGAGCNATSEMPRRVFRLQATLTVSEVDHFNC